MAYNGYTSYSATATLTYGFYIYNGSWVRVGGNTVYLYGSGYNNGGVKTLYQTDQITINYTGEFSDFRVVLESVDDGASGTITSVPDCTWTSQTVSSQRSATPNGEKITATMRPA